MDGWNLSTCAIKHPIELFVAILRTETSSMDTLSFRWAGIVFNFIIYILVIVKIFVNPVRIPFITYLDIFLR